ncbi:MAG: peptidoglycan-associated lipoprotein Pal [Alphaproteobacteria bacterium]|nr:peptidoglycan-associated lipoprotein Pal [Alphaproteobacteria bacterium]
MKMRFLSLLAAVALVAACESESDQNAAQTGGGVAQQPVRAATTNATATNQIVPGSTADFMATVGQDRVFFDFDKYDVKSEGRPVLEKWAVWLNKYPSVPVRIEGHADERGTREYNLALGERRANSVKQFLTSQGVAAARLQTITYGKERPAVQGHDESAWSQNRRAVAAVNPGPAS